MKWILRQMTCHRHLVDSEGNDIAPRTFVLAEVPDSYIVTDPAYSEYKTLEEAKKAIEKEETK